VFMGSERGPRLAPILATCSKEELVALADACSVLC
jgi:lysyl-tRNA synthetase class I